MGPQFYDSDSLTPALAKRILKAIHRGCDIERIIEAK